MEQLERSATFVSDPDEAGWPILICLLGSFRLLKAGQEVALRAGGKSEALLSLLALRRATPVPRAALMQELWPQSDAALAGQSLKSLVYSLHKLLGDGLGGAEPVIYANGGYRLNTDAGVGVDTVWLDQLVAAGERAARAGHGADAVNLYLQAVHLYRGDLCVGQEIEALIERERLRTRYLHLLVQLADRGFASGDYAACADYAQQILAADPCREDAHRLLMRCHVRRGERAQALRQYRLCAEILQGEFSALPEPATQSLFEQLRLDPAAV